ATLVTTQSSWPVGSGGAASADTVQPLASRGRATGARSMVSSGSRSGGAITDSLLVVPVPSLSASDCSASSSGGRWLSAVSTGGGAGASSTTVAPKSSSASSSILGASSSASCSGTANRSLSTRYAERSARRAALAVNSRRTRS